MQLAAICNWNLLPCIYATFDWGGGGGGGGGGVLVLSGPLKKIL